HYATFRSRIIFKRPGGSTTRPLVLSASKQEAWVARCHLQWAKNPLAAAGERVADLRVHRRKRPVATQQGVVHAEERRPTRHRSQQVRNSDLQFTLVHEEMYNK